MRSLAAEISSTATAWFTSSFLLGFLVFFVLVHVFEVFSVAEEGEREGAEGVGEGSADLKGPIARGPGASISSAGAACGSPRSAPHAVSTSRTIAAVRARRARETRAGLPATTDASTRCIVARA